MLFCTVLVQNHTIKDRVVFKIIFVMKFLMNPSESREEEGEVENSRRQIAICKRSNGVRDIDSPVNCDSCSYAQSLWEICGCSQMLWKKSWDN